MEPTYCCSARNLTLLSSLLSHFQFAIMFSVVLIPLLSIPCQFLMILVVNVLCQGFQAGVSHSSHLHFDRVPLVRQQWRVVFVVTLSIVIAFSNVVYFALFLSPLCQECTKTVWSPPPLPASLVRQWWQVRRQGTGIVGNRPQKWIGVALTTQASLIRGSSLENRCQGLKLPLGYPGTPIRIFHPIGQQSQHIIQ